MFVHPDPKLTEADSIIGDSHISKAVFRLPTFLEIGSVHFLSARGMIRHDNTTASSLSIVSILECEMVRIKW